MLKAVQRIIIPYMGAEQPELFLITAHIGVNYYTEPVATLRHVCSAWRAGGLLIG
jgi:hypothetical protein